MKKFLALVMLVLMTMLLTITPAFAEAVQPEETTFDWTTFFSTLLYAIMAAVVPIITTEVVSFVKKKRDQLTSNIADQELRNGINDACDAVLTAVTVTNQTYVDALKDKNIFDSIAQKNAFAKSWNMAQDLLTDAAKQALETLYGGVDKWLEAKIEETTNDLKKLKAPTNITDAVLLDK